MTCFWPCAFTIKRSVQTYGLNAMYCRPTLMTLRFDKVTTNNFPS